MTASCVSMASAILASITSSSQSVRNVWGSPEAVSMRKIVGGLLLSLDGVAEAWTSGGTATFHRIRAKSRAHGALPVARAPQVPRGIDGPADQGITSKGHPPAR